MKILLLGLLTFLSLPMNTYASIKIWNRSMETIHVHEGKFFTTEIDIPMGGYDEIPIDYAIIDLKITHPGGLSWPVIKSCPRGDFSAHNMSIYLEGGFFGDPTCTFNLDY